MRIVNLCPKDPAMLGCLRLNLVRMFASVLLITISLHAAAPAMGMVQDRGSAFSAATSDVAVMVQARQAEKVANPQPQPGGPEPVRNLIATEFDKLAWRPTFCSKPGSQGPPCLAIAERPAQPRAPPVD